MPEYPAFPFSLVLGAAWSLLRGSRRSFRRDALRCICNLSLKILGVEHIPQSGPGVVLVNHYYRPGFFAGWIALALSAAIPTELIWVMTAAWTEAGTLGSRLRAALSVPLFPRVARMYGFIPMPPMPPRPHEVAARAQAVRRILAAASQIPPPLLAFAPEGMDPPGGVLMRPPSGVGRLLAKLAQQNLRFYPVGVYEDEMFLTARFGASFCLKSPAGLSVDELDRQVADTAMEAIAVLLPPALRGVYG